MKNRNYWVVSPNVKNNDEENEWKEFLSKNPYSFIGWGADNQFGSTFINKIKKNDVIINAQRKNWEPHVFGIGIVSNDKCEWQEIENTPSGAYCRQLNPYLTKKRVTKLNLDFNGTAYYGDNKQIPAIYQLHPYKNENDKRLVEIIEKELEMAKKEQDIQKFVDLLKTNKNIILTGAPGTGKTYKTAEIAVALIDGSNKLPSNRVDLMKRYKELITLEQISFTTFHQSLDYEEFIEGLKPEIDEDSGEMTYQVKNGIFKKICNKATSNPENLQLEKFVESFLDNAIKKATEYETTLHKIKFKIIDFSVDKIKIEHGTFNNPNWNTPKNPIVKINYSDLLQLLQQPKKVLSKKEVATILKRKSNSSDNYLIAINAILYDSVQQQSTTFQKNNSDEPKYYDFIRKAWSGEKLTDENINYPIDKIVEFIKNEILIIKNKNNNNQPHILIIDEINRGNISKIFGELITLLEKDKRIGEENEITVTSPYSQETFGVPSNLFIIGTMNTADRSIGHIDYAIRRRFAFFSLKSDKNVISSYDKYDKGVKEKAESLFDKIKDFISNNINPDLNADDLMIGHSYFLCKSADDLKMRLEFEIIPLIEEYEKDGIIMLEKSAMKEEFEKWKNLLS
ncbi:MAG TPA: AAA family ATPase [Bacteroidales bacterium]|nr:AAA family ATPase [Bacteroidales bacterium]